MNTYQIEIYNMEYDEDMHTIQTALFEAGVRGEDFDGIGIYIQEGKGRSVFVEPSDLAKAVAVINALGFETDEDEQTEEKIMSQVPVNQEIVIILEEDGDGRPENLDGIRFQFSGEYRHQDDLRNIASAYVWSAEDYDDDEHTYCDDIEFSGFEVLSIARENNNDWATITIKINLDELKKAQAIWKDTYTS